MKKMLTAILLIVTCVLVFIGCDWELDDYYESNSNNLSNSETDQANTDNIESSELIQNGTEESKHEFHSYGDWIISKKADCINNGEEERYCVCGERQIREIIASGHNFGEWQIERKSTCKEPGVETQFCDCGESRSKVIPMLEHINGDWVIEKAATCTEIGMNKQLCEMCNDVLESAEIPAKGHKSGSFQCVKNPSCTETGEKQEICIVCKEVLRTEVMPANGHGYEIYYITTESTCTKQGEGQYKCNICNTILRTEKTPQKGHNYQKTRIYATCEVEGGYQYACSRCSDSYFEKTSEPEGHDLKISGICSKCNKDYSVNMRTRIGEPIENCEHGFSYYSYAYLDWSWQAVNKSGKEIKYCTFEINIYNAVGDVVYTKTAKKTGPFSSSGIINLSSIDDGLALIFGHKNFERFEITYIQLQYSDNSIECGYYGYSTTKKDSSLTFN